MLAGVRLEVKKTDDVKAKIQELLDGLYKEGVLVRRGKVSVVKENVKPYYRNTYETIIMFDE